MGNERVALVNSLFHVEFVDYARPGDGLLISSGAGIGMAIMDTLPALRWFCDVDAYRKRQDIDWEAVAVMLTAGSWRPSAVVMAGWFSLDRPEVFDAFERGVVETPVFRYEGGQGTTLADFLQTVKTSGCER